MEKLAQEFYALSGITLNSRQLTAIRIYERELLSWNQKYNLTAIQEPEKIRVKHFLDSLSAFLVMRGSVMEQVIDIGTGAGFPGLPLKILNPNIKLTLVESVGKKTDFCRHIVDILELNDVIILQERAEALGIDDQYREQYDWVLARAVAIMPVLIEYLLPLARVGGHVLAMKGDGARAEVQAAQNATQILGGHLRQLTPVTLPGVVEERYLVVVDKVAATPENYPRRIGIPSKRPL